MWMIKNSAARNKAQANRSDTEQEAFNQALIAAHVDVGARPLIMCDCTWANEEYSNWGITTYPNLDSRIKQAQALEKFGFFQSTESLTLLGTLMGELKPVNLTPEMVYSLWMVRSDPAATAAYKALSKADQDALWAGHSNAFDRLGGCMIVTCGSYWANDAYRGFGVEAFPHIEAMQEFKAELEKLDWPLYMPAVSTLGTLSPVMSMVDTIFGPK
jgi:hypothetical protein